MRTPVDQRRCFVCGAYGVISLGIRARDRDTNAVWAPNLDAYLCDAHARSGAHITVTYAATETGHVIVQTFDATTKLVSEIDLPIGAGKKRPPGQGELE